MNHLLPRRIQILAQLSLGQRDMGEWRRRGLMPDRCWGDASWDVDHWAKTKMQHLTQSGRIIKCVFAALVHTVLFSCIFPNESLCVDRGLRLFTPSPSVCVLLFVSLSGALSRKHLLVHMEYCCYLLMSRDAACSKQHKKAMCRECI